MSMMSAPQPTPMRAASAIAEGSQPASCSDEGEPSIAAIRSVVRFSRTMALEAIISDTTSPAPSSRAKRRNGRSVTPDIGASTTGTATAMPPPRSIGGNACRTAW